MTKLYDEINYLPGPILYKPIPQAPAPVRVKALQWQFEQEDVQVADTSARHQYRIVHDRRATSGAWMWFCDGRWIACETADAAKAAAQADYAARILAALEPDAGVVAELAEALRNLLAAYSKPDERICCNGHECGNMLSDNAAADNWKAWLDDLPLDAGFAEGVGRVQDFISGTVARAEAAEAEAATLRDRLARMEGALTAIDALDPEGRIGDCSVNAISGLVLRMGEIARAALTDGGSNG